MTVRASFPILLLSRLWSNELARELTRLSTSRTCSSQVCLFDSRVRLACRVLKSLSVGLITATIAKPHHVLLAKRSELSACMSPPLYLSFQSRRQRAALARLLACISPKKVIVNPKLPLPSLGAGMDRAFLVPDRSQLEARSRSVLFNRGPCFRSRRRSAETSQPRAATAFASCNVRSGEATHREKEGTSEWQI